MNQYASLVQKCVVREQEELKKGIEPGPVILSRLEKRLERNFFAKFQEISYPFALKLKSIGTEDEFNLFHQSFIQVFRQEVKTRGGTIVSYGEAQKPINIFLKEYVEKSKLLDSSIIARLSPLLHVTLDGVVVAYMQSFFREEYDNFITPVSRTSGLIDTLRSPQFRERDLSESLQQQLMFINREIYYAWQGWFRQISPERPVLLDAIWSIARQTLFT
jgi:hypothetical protein